MPIALGERGLRIWEEPVIALPNGDWKFISGRHKFDVIGCRHCGATILVVLRGLNARLTTKYRCQSCDGPICRFCAENLQGANGACFPIKAKVEFKIRVGRWPEELGVFDYRRVPASLR